MEDSISETITTIQAALQDLNAAGDYSIFISRDVVTRPPFPYFYGLVELISRAKPSLGWKPLLLSDEGYVPQTKKEKLSFLTRLLALVSQTASYRYDIFVQPSNIVCGQDVLSTHRFLRALVACIQASPNIMSTAVAKILDEGEVSLYKRAVRTRCAFKRFQAVVRGWMVRRQYNNQTKADVSDMSIEMTDSVQNVLTSSIHEKSDEVEDDGPDNAEIEANRKAQSMAAELLDSYNDMLYRKSKAEDELKATGEKLVQEKSKLVRVLNLRSKHKKQSREQSPASSLPLIRPPYSAPSNNIERSTRNRQSIRHLPRADEAFVDKIINLSIAEREAKKKAKRLEERELVLKQRMIRSKHKESELKIQEQRVSDLADKIRRQQLQLKEQKLLFEQSKFAAPPSPPDSTSRPCTLCTEKEIYLRDVKDKVKRRMRLLNRREAEVIGRAQELRRREVKLLQLQNEIVDTRPSDGSTESRNVKENQNQHEENSREAHQNKRRRNVNANAQEHATAEAKNQPQHSKADTKSAAPIPADEEVISIRSSFGENAVPTIAEEPHQTDDDSSVETYNHEDEPASDNIAPDLSTTTCPMSEEPDTKENQQKNPTREQVIPMRVPTLKENLKKQSGTVIDIPFDKTKRKGPLPKSKPPSPAKQRHVFVFEKKRHQESNKERKSIQSSSRGNKREKHDEDNWISSFDVQMKCAMTKLKELV